jgi:hypothetical protein
MSEQEKLEYIWNNINLIYLKLEGLGYQVEYNNLDIFSSDSHFKCKITMNYHILLFNIEKEYSLISSPKYYLFSSNFEKIDDIIKILKPIFRDFKIDTISNEV